MDGVNPSTFLDITALVAIAFCTWKGATKGAVWQLATLGSVALGVFFAAQLAPYIEANLSPDFAPELRHGIALGAAYLGLSLITFLVARKLRLWCEKYKLVEFDSHWGAILGASKGATATLVVVCTVAVLIPGLRATIQSSKCGLLAHWALRLASPVLPDSWSATLSSALEQPPGQQSGQPPTQ